ncbi:MAG TPA: cyclic nucleotide-binding domain-containing protein [Candidatus Ozemobacteraceae bacterium]|nr:cyclic nucleotide-binding domain-containing protein [Candidatus Ozemobacteraceae bacterium]
MIQTDFLKGVALFSGLGDDEFKRLNERAEVVKFVRDAFICKEGQKADSMYIIRSGIVQVFCDDGHGGRKILTHLKQGEYFGEMALFTDEPRTASVIALAETDVIRLKKDDLYAILESAPKVSIAIIRTLCERLARANIGSAGVKTGSVYAVMGPDTSSGKSLFARNLALAMQQNLGKDVLLFDPNLRDDRVARQLGVEQRSRIIDELVDRERIADLKKYIVKAPCGLMTLLPQENGLTDLRLKEFHTFALIKTILESFEFIVIDSSSMFTKVTKEILESSSKIVYLISSKNVSVRGLIDHFEETRRTWKIAPERVVYGVNRLTDDPKQEGVISEADRKLISFEIPFDKALHQRREPDRETLVQRDPAHPLATVAKKQAEAILYDQVLTIALPALENDAARRELAKRWAETGVQELSKSLRNVELKSSKDAQGNACHLLSGRTAKWLLNQQMVTVIDFAGKYKQEFALDKIIFTLNGQESTV